MYRVEIAGEFSLYNKRVKIFSDERLQLVYENLVEEAERLGYTVVVVASERGIRFDLRN